MAEFEERDLFLSVDHQQELRRRLGTDQVTPPQVFIDGNLLGVSVVSSNLTDSIICLQDCYFTEPIHMLDELCFAFRYGFIILCFNLLLMQSLFFSIYEE